MNLKEDQNVTAIVATLVHPTKSALSNTPSESILDLWTFTHSSIHIISSSDRHLECLGFMYIMFKIYLQIFNHACCMQVSWLQDIPKATVSISWITSCCILRYTLNHPVVKRPTSCRFHFLDIGILNLETFRGIHSSLISYVSCATGC